MRCETSFFSLTLFKKHLQRYWPMWAVWLVIWALVIPIPLWNARLERSGVNAQVLAQSYPEMLAGMSWAIATAAILVAVAVYFHLFKAPAAQFVGALPLRREGVFATAFSAGYTMLAAPLTVVSLVTLLVEAAVGAWAPGAIFAWLGGCLLLCFFWFSFATLCCVITGNGVAGACFYGIFNGVFAVMTLLIQSVLAQFLYGFDELSEGVWMAIAWITPIIQTTMGDTYVRGELGTSRFELLWIYAAVGFLMFLAVLGLHHIRKAERTGDLVAFGPLRYIFKVSVTLCGGLAFGLLLDGILFSFREVNKGMALAGCCAVAAVVSWFAAEMLLAKSFKVFKDHWKGALIGAMCFVVAICALDMDWIGFTTRVPAPGQVKAAHLEVNGNIGPAAQDLVCNDPEAVRAVVELHQYLCDHKNEVTEGGDYYSLRLTYDLGLTKLTRQYSYNCGGDSQLYTLTGKAVAAATVNFDTAKGVPSVGYLDMPAWDTDADGVTYVKNYESRELTAGELETLWAAIQEDVAAGRYRTAIGEDYGGPIQLGWVAEKDAMEYQNFYVCPRTTSVVRALEGMGIENIFG